MVDLVQLLEWHRVGVVQMESIKEKRGLAKKLASRRLVRSDLAGAKCWKQSVRLSGAKCSMDSLDDAPADTF